MDDPQLLAPDVILNMLISYRDVQVGTQSLGSGITVHTDFVCNM